ncbi:MAG: TlpA family protein disulfide reductase [Dehalococcoidia bacterium]|nr:TlpA family protein disulfide reductase [Dehalococcoidia bacterium]
MNTALKIILAIILTSAILIAGCAGEVNQTPKIGEPAPDFQFQSSAGQATSLSDLKGKPVLINFWQIRCLPCRVEMPYIQQVYNEWQEKGLILLAINIKESPSQIEQFMQSQELSLPVLLDSEGSIAERYGIRAIPATFLIDRDGIIQDIKFGPFQSKAEIESSLDKIALTK